MSFTANNEASITTASDNNAVGAQRVNEAPLAASASYLVTLKNGTTTFTGSYRGSTGGEATFSASRIIVEVH
jgi:hypothetical protein